MIGYSRGFRPLLWTVLAALLVTGLLLVPGALELRWELSAPGLPTGWRIGTAAAHTICAFLTLVLLGSLATLHMRLGLRRRESLISGLTLVGTFVALMLTALGIYYLADESLGRWSSGLHMAFGVAAAGSATVHAIRGRRLRAARLARANHPPTATLPAGAVPFERERRLARRRA